MYTGFNPPKPPDKRRRFSVLFACCLIAVVFIASIALSVANSLEFGIYRDEEGSVYMSVAGQVFPERLADSPATRPTADDIPMVEISRVPDPVVQDSSGREILPGNEVYRKIVPSVVGIVSSYGGMDSGATGTGIIMSEDGIIATNYHVVNGAREIIVVFEDGTEARATLLGQDYYTDLAAIKIDAHSLVPAEFGSSDQLEPGDVAYAVGNPLGLDLQNTITDGIISAINRDIVFSDAGTDLNMTVIQTSCAVNPGNSGGPLCNKYGQVVGIISSKIMGDAFSQVEGLGFAIPTSVAQPVLNDLISLGYVSGRPAIGIIADLSIVLDERTAAYYGFPVGVVVESVTPGTDAEAKGIREGDIVTHVNGQQVKSVSEINAIKNQFKVGDVLVLSIYRAGQTFDLDIVLVEAK